MSSKQTTQSSSTTTPWDPQATALTTAFNGANGALNQTTGLATPSNFVAGFNPNQLTTFNNMVGYGNASTLPQFSANVGQGIGVSGLDGTQGALSTLGAFNPAAANNPQTLINNANQYAAGMDIPALTRAAMQPSMEMARDVTMPGIDAAAAGTGNTNGSRTGIAQGLVERGLAENAQNTAAQLQGAAYSQGLGLANDQANQNNTLALNAMNSRGTLGLGAASAGVNAASSSIADQGNLYSQAAEGGAGQNAGDQASINNALAQWQAAQQAPFTPLQNYMSIVGSNNWGNNQQGTSTTTGTPSGWSIAGGLLSGIGGFMSPTSGIGKFL